MLTGVEKGTVGRRRLPAAAKEIANRIAQARKLAGMTVDESMHALGLSKNQYVYLEQQCNPDHAQTHLPRVAELFKVPLDWLMYGSGDEGTKGEVHEHGAQSVPLIFEVLTSEKARWLGNRAKNRRDELAFSRPELAQMFGVSPINLMKWEQSLPRTRRPIEVEWEKALRVPEGWLRNTHLKAYPPAPFPRLEPAEGMTVAREMQAVCSWFARKNPYHRTIDYDTLSPAEVRMVDIMLHRFGVYGEEVSTLQNIGDRIGLTRERVRQIGEEFIKNLDQVDIVTPALDRLVFDIQASLPCKVEDLDRVCRGLLGDSLTIVGADRFAREVLGKSVVKMVSNPSNMQGHSALVAIPEEAPDAADLRAIRQVAVSMVRSCGAAQLHFVAGMSSTILKRGITPEEVERSCKFFNHFEWLSEEDGWFWFGPAADNRAKTAALKVLSVATRNVDVEEIHDAMSRARMLRYTQDRQRPYMVDVPQVVLREVLTRIPGIETVQYNDFRLDVAISPEDVLSETEMAIWNVIQLHGGVVTRQILLEEVLATRDITTVALNFAIDGSPILVRLDKGLWSIRGTRINAQAVAAAIALNAASAGGGARFFRETPEPVDGWWNMRVAVPESAIVRRHWIVPVAVETLLSPGEYAVEGFDEPANFTIGVNANLGGFVGKLLVAGVEPNEVFLLGIHASERKIRFKRIPPLDAEQPQ